ncbi:MAG: hypothetical protein V1843_01395, partial [bacterium]
FINNFKKTIVRSNGTTLDKMFNTQSYVIGGKYKAKTNTEIMLEYYYNGMGLNGREMSDFITYVNNGYNRYVSTGDDSMLQKASTLEALGYGGIGSMTNYLYGRLIQHDTFGIKTLNPALTIILNLDDKSYAAMPEISYSILDMWDLRLRLTIFQGAANSEFGERRGKYEIETKIRYYF